RPYQVRKEDEAFALAWDDALEEAADALELEARRRACEGLRKVKFHNGEPIMVPALGPDGRPLVTADNQPVLVPYVEHEYSDVLLIFLLKAARPEKFRERYEVRHGGTVGLDLRGLSDAELSARI